MVPQALWESSGPHCLIQQMVHSAALLLLLPQWGPKLQHPTHDQDVQATSHPSKVPIEAISPRLCPCSLLVALQGLLMCASQASLRGRARATCRHTVKRDWGCFGTFVNKITHHWGCFATLASTIKHHWGCLATPCQHHQAPSWVPCDLCQHLWAQLGVPCILAVVVVGQHTSASGNFPLDLHVQREPWGQTHPHESDQLHHHLLPDQLHHHLLLHHLLQLLHFPTPCWLHGWLSPPQTHRQSHQPSHMSPDIQHHSGIKSEPKNSKKLPCLMLRMTSSQQVSQKHVSSKQVSSRLWSRQVSSTQCSWEPGSSWIHPARSDINHVTSAAWQWSKFEHIMEWATAGCSQIWFQ